MLEIRKVKKIYETEGLKQKALDGVSVNFRENEFASILGPSGSGKTTFLNIIGGLDHYTSGDLIINENSTKNFSDSDWDSYRNHRIGFVFQSYNLISHQSILSNVCLALTLSGISKKESVSRAKKALKDVGLEDHIYKKPNQLSGGQMQRVAIARALVNDPDILLADEPTGALDSETSIQIMELLKKIAKKKLVIMVTHNPELAEEYSSRIIKLKDGKIISDSNPYDGKVDTKESLLVNKTKSKKTNMSFKTALSLSFNNLMTKKGRTILVSFAGSIGIIGVALILALSTGFQNYIDQIQEDTLTSYPLTLREESADITSTLLSMTSGSSNKGKKGEVKESQYMTSMFSNISKNDLKSFKKYLEKNYSKVDKDLATVKYDYSIDPLIYTVDVTGKLAKVNPNNLFSSLSGGSMLSSYSSSMSIFSHMIDNKKMLDEQYDVLAGKWPEKYDEMVIVLSDSGSISDLLVYSLGLRDTEELNRMVKGLMSGESVNINNEPLTLTYEDLLNVKLKLIKPTDTYKFNSAYNIYEDMSTDEAYMKNLYNKATDLKIVGVVSAKEGVSSMTLSPGVAYTSELIDYIISESSKTDIVKKQLENKEVDVFSGSRFDDKKSGSDLDFKNIITVDNEKLKNAFNIQINQKEIENKTKKYMAEISDSITTDITPAKIALSSGFDKMSKSLFKTLPSTFSLNDVPSLVSNYLNSEEATSIMNELSNNYVLPAESYREIYNGLLNGLLQMYIASYNMVDPSLTVDPSNPTALVYNEMVPSVISNYSSNAHVQGGYETLAKYMTEALMKKTVSIKIGQLIENITSSFASAFKVDESQIASAFSFNLSEEELTRIVSAMMNQTEKSAKTNLLSLGYQDKEEPTYILLYFSSFDGKDHFIKFLDKYNKKMEKSGLDDKVINYSDTTGILMGSVKTIVNAVSYVLIAFVSISLVVSSIMIGVITYISVYERTKEIGILRAIGASKHNISSIFNAETFIIGFLSGLIGIGITYLLIPVINMVIHHFIGNIPLNAALNISNAGMLVLLSIILTLIGGFIPAKTASKKDPVEALRSE